MLDQKSQKQDRWSKILINCRSGEYKRNEYQIACVIRWLHVAIEREEWKWIEDTWVHSWTEQG